MFAQAGAPPSWEQTLLAAQLASRTERLVTVGETTRFEEIDDVVAAGRTALWLRGCTRLGKPAQHELLTRRARPPAVAGAVVRRTAVLSDADTELVNGVPSLAVPRLAVDLAGLLLRVEIAAVLDDLLCKVRAISSAEVHDRAKQLRRGRSGVDYLIELTGPDAPGVFWSWLERHTAAVFTAAALPSARWNCDIRDDAGHLIGVGDAVWTEHRVVVELDGLRFHRTPEQQRRDRRKDRQLATAGWLVLRYSWLEVVERPSEVVAEVRRALAQRRPTLAI